MGRPSDVLRPGQELRVSATSKRNTSPSNTHDEAAAAVATDPDVSPAGYGLGRHGWIAVTVAQDAAEDRWRQIAEWAQTSYCLLAPKRLARIATEPDGTA